MSRYYDLDSLRVSDINVGTVMFPRMERCILLKDIESAPTADVVPKSEVDLYKRQVDELEDELASTYDKLETAKAEVAREIFAEIEQQLRELFDFFRQDDGIRESGAIMMVISEIAEFKKKYTEGK